MYYYADKATKIFATLSNTKLDDPAYFEVPIAPESGLSLWDGRKWVLLTYPEIEKYFPGQDEETEVDSGEIATPISTTENGIVLWRDTSGAALKDSGITFDGKTIEVPGNINAKGDYLINGVKINGNSESSGRHLLRQKVIETNEVKYGLSTWQQIPGMMLKSKNTSTSDYVVAIELLVKVSRNSRDFEFALFVNGKQDFSNTLSIDFSRSDDDKTINWSDEFKLEPETIVTVCWRGDDRSSVDCSAGRRKLAISQIPEGKYNASEEMQILNIQPSRIQSLSTPTKEDWFSLSKEGREVTHGNKPQSQLRYKQGMSLVRDLSGISFTGASPFASWVKFEWLKWKRGEGKTLSIVFAATNGICQLGIGSDEIDEKSSNLFYSAELNIYLNQSYLFKVVGNRGDLWKGASTHVSREFTTYFHRLEIENDGAPGSAIKVYDLPSVDKKDWDNKDKLLYSSKINANHTSDSKILMPMLLATNGSGLRIAAIKVA